MLQRLMPEWLYNEISKNFIIEFVYEIRLRLNKPILINYKGNYKILSNKVGYKDIPIITGHDLLEFVFSTATKQSLYAYNDQIKHCYVTFDGGIRIGICGTVTECDGKVQTIKNITSLNIRVAHEVPNCSEKIINFIYQNGYVKNTLVISPPGAGKTTLIRDLCHKLSNEKLIKNILVVDERFEIAGEAMTAGLDVGDFSDIISGSNKNFAFDEALKTMNPSVIVTDEVSNEKDMFSIQNAIKSGVSVIATAHARSIQDLKYKKYFETILRDKYFERIVVLSSRNGVGTIDGVFDENLKCIFVPYLS